MIRNKISSDLKILDQLNQKYPWIPSSEQIRPSPIDLIHKNNRLNMIRNEWKSMEDYIRFKIFGQKALINENNQKEIKTSAVGFDLDVGKKWVFAESEFKYNIISESNHWVLWSSEHTQDDQTISDLEINDRLKEEISLIVGSDEFDYAWYQNPKPTIREFFHVQVFWLRLA